MEWQNGLESAQADHSRRSGNNQRLKDPTAQLHKELYMWTLNNPIRKVGRLAIIETYLHGKAL